MQINIQTQDFALTDSLRNHVERRLYFALSCCDDHIQHVGVRLSEINGPRGGADKCCDLHIIMFGLPEVMIKDIETDLYLAIDRATDRAGRTVIRKIDRHQSLLRQGHPGRLI